MSDAIAYQRTTGVIPRKVAGEMVLVPLGARSTNAAERSADLYVLNETGEVLWEQLARPITIAHMARNLMSAFDITADRAEADVRTFIADLVEIGAVVRTEMD